jgi:predicted small lipoprotein YifL
MKTKLGKFVSVLSMLGLLASCAQMGPLEAENANTHKAAETATTYADHNRLEKQYQNIVKESLVKAEEQKKLLEHYEEKSYLYGRRAQDLRSHTEALLHRYQQTAEESVKQASFHQKMASEIEKRNYATPAETPNQRDNKAKARAGSNGNAL